MSFLRFFVSFLANFGNNLIQSTNFTNPIFSFPKSFDQILRTILRINLKHIFLVVFLFSLIFNSIFSTLPVLTQNNNSNNNSDLQEVYPLHNQKFSNRINLIFINDGFSIPEFGQRVIDLLDFDSVPKKVKTDSSSPQKLSWGFFAIEPNRSNKQKFNIWTIDKYKVENYSSDNKCDKDVKFFRQKFGFEVAITIKVIKPEGSNYKRAGACHIESNAPKKVTKLSDLESLDYPVAIFYYLQSPSDQSVLAHEMSHAIFGLDDEYSDAFGVKIGTPNAAKNEETAKDWWQDWEGQVDPFYYEWKKVNGENGYQVLDSDNFKIGYYRSGCLAAAGSCIIPTKNSIMNNIYEAQIYGSVNSRRINEIYNLFDGQTINLSSQNSLNSNISSNPNSQNNFSFNNSNYSSNNNIIGEAISTKNTVSNIASNTDKIAIPNSLSVLKCPQESNKDGKLTDLNKQQCTDRNRGYKGHFNFQTFGKTGRRNCWNAWQNIKDNGQIPSIGCNEFGYVISECDTPSRYANASPDFVPAPINCSNKIQSKWQNVSKSVGEAGLESVENKQIYTANDIMSNNISNCFFVPKMVNNFKENITYCNITLETKTADFFNFGSVEVLAGEKIVEGDDILGIKNKFSNNTSDKIASKIDGIGDTNPTCGQNTISIEKIITPGAFFPVIPCAVKDGKVQPLSPALIPDILVRAFGLIASLTFYLFSGILILSGVMFIWDGIDGQSRKRAERNIIDTLWALVLIFGAYTILITILTLLKFDFDKTRMKFFDF